MAVFLFVLRTNKKNSHRSIAGTIRPSNFTYLAKRLCLLDFRQRDISLLKSLLFSLGRFVPTKSYQGSCAPFVYLCTLPRLTSLIGKTIRLVFSFTDFSSVNHIYSILNELTYMELPKRTIKSLGRTVPDYPNTNSERIGIFIIFP